MSLVTVVLTPDECSVVSDGRISSEAGGIYYEHFQKFRLFAGRFIVLGGGYQQPLIDFWHDLETTTLDLTWSLVEEYLANFMTIKTRYFVLANHEERDETVANIVLCGINDQGQIAAHAFTNDGYGMYDKVFTEPQPGEVAAITCPPREYPQAQQLLAANIRRLGPGHHTQAQIDTQLTVAEKAASVNDKTFGLVLDKQGHIRKIQTN